MKKKPHVFYVHTLETWENQLPYAPVHAILCYRVLKIVFCSLYVYTL